MTTKVQRLDAARGRVALAKLARDKPELADSPQLAGAHAWLDDVERDEGDEAMADDTKEIQVVVRLTKAMADRLDTHAERLRAEMPGPTWSRSDVVRSLLANALDAADGAAPKGRRGK